MKILLSLLLAIAGSQGTQAGSDQGVVNGRVTNATGAEGFPEVSVLLVGPLTGAAANAATSNPLMIEEIAEGSGARAIRATTDNLGRVVFRNLPSGQYMLKVQKEGYLGAVPTAIGGLTSMATASVIVTSGAAADVRIPLLRAAVLSGRIRDAGGRPLPNATVVAILRASSRTVLHRRHNQHVSPPAWVRACAGNGRRSIVLQDVLPRRV
jgi:type IV secretory pathway protease TraF